MAEKKKSNIIGNLWTSNLSDGQKNAGVKATGKIQGIGRVTVWANKKPREGKKDAEMYITVDERQDAPKGKPQPKSETPEW